MMKSIAISRALRAAAARREREDKSPNQRTSLAATMKDRLGRPDSQARSGAMQPGDAARR